MVEAELYAHLSSDISITDSVANRIYPLVAPEGVQAPYITYQNISDVDLTSLQGDNYSNKVLFQIDIYSTSYLEAKEILGAVKESMYKFKYIPHEFNSRDLYEKDTELHRQLIQFKINKKR